MTLQHLSFIITVFRCSHTRLAKQIKTLVNYYHTYLMVQRTIWHPLEYILMGTEIRLMVHPTNPPTQPGKPRTYHTLDGGGACIPDTWHIYIYIYMHMCVHAHLYTVYFIGITICITRMCIFHELLYVHKLVHVTTIRGNQPST